MSEQLSAKRYPDDFDDGSKALPVRVVHFRDDGAVTQTIDGDTFLLTPDEAREIVQAIVGAGSKDPEQLAAAAR